MSWRIDRFAKSTRELNCDKKNGNVVSVCRNNQQWIPIET